MKNLINTLLVFVFLLLTFSLISQDYDIYRINTSSGEIQQVTNLSDVDEYNPSFSNDGKFMVHDVVDPPFNILAVTEISTGVTSLIPGVFIGNDGSWSPNGSFIAYDDFVNIYVVPAEGGTPQLVREAGVDAEWSQSSRHLVFTDILSGTISTIEISTGSETVVADYGINPSWSNNGKYIVFSDENNLFKIAVNQAGEPKGVPMQLTYDDRSTLNQQPSWSNNDKTIVFHSNREGGDFDIWTVPASGGNPTLLTGLSSSGDYDPAYAKNGRWVAYSSLTDPPAPVVEKKDDRSAIEVPYVLGTKVQTFPNPFRNIVFLRYELDETTEASLQIFDAKGTLITTLVETIQDAGIHEIQWNGLTASGVAIPAGRYTYSLKTNKGQCTGQIIRIKSR